MPDKRRSGTREFDYITKGWLYKLGSDLGLGLGSDLGLAVEQRRYFVLDGGKLLYYRTDEKGSRGLDSRRAAVLGEDDVASIISSAALDIREKHRDLKKKLSSAVFDLGGKRASTTEADSSASQLGEAIGSYNLNELIGVAVGEVANGRFTIETKKTGPVYLRCDSAEDASRWASSLERFVAADSNGGAPQLLPKLQRGLSFNQKGTRVAAASSSSSSSSSSGEAPPPPPRRISATAVPVSSEAAAPSATQWAIESVQIAAKRKGGRAKECGLFWRAELGEHLPSAHFIVEVMLIDGLVLKVEHKPNDNDGKFTPLPVGVGNTTLMVKFSTVAEVAAVNVGAPRSLLSTLAAVAFGVAIALLAVQLAPQLFTATPAAYISLLVALVSTPLAFRASASKASRGGPRRFQLDLQAVATADAKAEAKGKFLNSSETSVVKGRRRSMSASGNHLRRRRAASGAAMPVMVSPAGRARRGSSLAMQRRSSISPRRQSSLAQELGEVLEEGDGNDEPMVAIVNFSGKWTLDHAASSDPTEQLTALGVPWLARKAIAAASRTLEIEQVEWSWRELVSTSIITKETTFSIDGAEHQEVSPIDKSVVSMCTMVEEEGMCIVTRNEYLKQGHSAEIRRWLEDDGMTYHVENTLEMAGGKVITVNNYFRKTD